MEKKEKSWQKYPMERVIMNKKKHEAFVNKCKKTGLAKSRAINLLIDKWLVDEVEITSK